MNEISLEVFGLYKMYKMYDKPKDRLKEALGLNRKIYHKEFYALENINFKVYHGETVGIIGTNGSGKSTLLKIITGVLSPSGGSVTTNGRLAALLELGAGFNPEYTGYENIYLNGSIFGFSKNEMDKKIDDIIKFADIGDFIYQPVKTYSSGMFARLAFAVAINVDPDILVVDEILAVGDLEFQLKCMEKFNEFRDNGNTILYVSHDINSIKRYCNTCIWIQNGKIEAIGSTDNITDKYLDYLKKESVENSVSTDLVNGLSIGQISNVKIMNQFEEEIDTINHHEKIIVKIDYELLKNISNPVIGLAIRSIDNKYICGLNTKLDQYEIPNKIGNNVIHIEYNNFNLVGGTYYFDVALFESNAHVPIDYKAKVKKFAVQMPYIGEGICILDHKWFMRGE